MPVVYQLCPASSKDTWVVTIIRDIGEETRQGAIEILDKVGDRFLLQLFIIALLNVEDDIQSSILELLVTTQVSLEEAGQSW